MPTLRAAASFFNKPLQATVGQQKMRRPFVPVDFNPPRRNITEKVNGARHPRAH